MKDWIARLDDFLKMTGNDILTHACKISHQKALKKAQDEYEKYHQQQLQQPTQAKKDYIRLIEQTAGKLKKKKLFSLIRHCAGSCYIAVTSGFG